jgi:hypothetical protein
MRSDNAMKGMFTLLLVTAALGLTGQAAYAQKTLSSSIDVYVFPKAGQSAEDQSKAEAECYDFAVTSTGTDPFEAMKQADAQKQAARQQQQQAAQQAQGAGLKGAARGAAAGALIGGIADNRAGQGSAWGAAAGAMGGRASARRSQRSAAQQAEQQVAQAEQNKEAAIDDFRKAFSVCLEAKEYMVRF